MEARSTTPPNTGQDLSVVGNQMHQHHPGAYAMPGYPRLWRAIPRWPPMPPMAPWRAAAPRGDGPARGGRRPGRPLRGGGGRAAARRGGRRRGRATAGLSIAAPQRTAAPAPAAAQARGAGGGGSGGDVGAVVGGGTGGRIRRALHAQPSPHGMAPSVGISPVSPAVSSTACSNRRRDRWSAPRRAAPTYTRAAAGCYRGGGAATAAVPGSARRRPRRTPPRTPSPPPRRPPPPPPPAATGDRERRRRRGRHVGAPAGRRCPRPHTFPAAAAAAAARWASARAGGRGRRRRRQRDRRPWVERWNERAAAAVVIRPRRGERARLACADAVQSEHLYPNTIV